MSIDSLTQAIHSLNADDALQASFSADEWRLLASYLQRYSVRAGDTLVRYRDMDRVLYLLESGTLQVFVPDAAPVRRPWPSCGLEPWWVSPACSEKRRAWRRSKRCRPASSGH